MTEKEVIIANMQKNFACWLFLCACPEKQCGAGGKKEYVGKPGGKNRR